jgi:hypothetical protein
MRSGLLTMTLAMSSLAVAACGGRQNQVEVKGGDAELATIAGHWEGTYTGLDSGRSGPVSFSLQLGRHTADGTVLLGGERPLRIQFVAVERGRVSGTIDPYTDPSCDCQVTTQFVGTVAGDTITGTFKTHVAALDVEQTGQWSVVRRN